MILQAKVAPVGGKHYGTRVFVCGEATGYSFEVQVCVPYGPPSDEDLTEWFGKPMTSQDWLDNVLVPDGWDGESMSPIQREYPCDSHYQSRFEAAVAKRIAEALDGFEVDA